MRFFKKKIAVHICGLWFSTESRGDDGAFDVFLNGYQPGSQNLPPGCSRSPS